MSEHLNSSVAVGEEERRGISGWWIAIIVAILVLFCICCLSILVAYFIFADIIFEIFNQLTFQFA